MKFLIGGEQTEVSANKNGNTLEYLAYCFNHSAKTSTTPSEHSIADYSQRQNTLCNLMQARPDTRALLEQLLDVFHPKLLLDILISPTAKPHLIDLSGYMTHSHTTEKSASKPLSPLAASLQKTLQTPPLQSLQTAIMKALDTKDSDTDFQRKQQLAKQIQENKHGWWEEDEIISTHDHPEQMAFMLTKILWLLPDDEHYLTAEQGFLLLRNHSDLYRPDVLHAFFQLVDFRDREEKTETSNTPSQLPKEFTALLKSLDSDKASLATQSIRAQNYLIMQAITLMSYSTNANAQKVLTAVNQYFHTHFAIQQQPSFSLS